VFLILGVFPSGIEARRSSSREVSRMKRVSDAKSYRCSASQPGRSAQKLAISTKQGFDGLAEDPISYFLNRFSKAWRASLCRGGATEAAELFWV
jgi:hypothetical protein